MKIALIIVAAGQGARMRSATPKQFHVLGGRPVFEWSLQTAQGHEKIDQVILVASSDVLEHLDLRNDHKTTVVAGGATRTESVLAGLSACDLAPEDIVLIHDAARPGLSARIISELIAALDDAEGAAPALPVADALKRQTGLSLESVDRSDLFRVQTPQAFRFDRLKQALSGQTDLVDDLAALEASGGRFKLIAGDERLGKITFPEDFARLEAMLTRPLFVPRIGSGFDVHAFEPGTHVTLCGVAIPHSHKLKGHSDADVGWHALTDAIFGAAALGDLGDHFPPSDPKWKNVDSAIFLRRAVEAADEAGFSVANCDITIICEAPKVKPHREAMRKRTAEVLGVPLDVVSIKATTTETLGFTGRGEGIAAQASVLLAPSANRL